MKIDSGSHGYQYPARAHTIERASEETVQREAEPQHRSGSTLTGSSTLLSSSLANALWVIGDGSTAAQAKPAATAGEPGIPVDWVEDLYMEFAD